MCVCVCVCVCIVSECVRTREGLKPEAFLSKQATARVC